MALERIDKILGIFNICTRSEAKTIIKKGLVTINGEVIKDSSKKADIEKDIITAYGKTLGNNKYIYIMMNKPSGVISATVDKSEKTVLDIIPKEFKRNGLFPAGRLDKDTEGLLIITNDGEFAHNMLSPVKEIYKRYYAKTDLPITNDMIQKFKEGIIFSDGTKCKSAILEYADDGCFVTICEGKFHQVKKMLSAVGLSVLYLKRLSIGSLSLDDNLKVGDCREISADEKALLLLNKN